MLDLLAVPAIAARFGLEDADRMRVQDWLECAGARWGLDARDRARHGAEGDAYTLELQRHGLDAAIAAVEASEECRRDRAQG